MTTRKRAEPLVEHSSNEWLTLEDVATELRVPKATVYRWSAARLFRTVKLGKHIRVRREWLEAWIDGRAA